MGIKNINSLIKKLCPSAFREIKMSSIAGKRIAIDSPLWLFSNIATILKYEVNKMVDVLQDIDREILIQKVILHALKFHIGLMKHDIIPIWLADGDTPIEKKLTRMRRREGREKQVDKIGELKEKILSQDELLRDSKDVADLKKALQNSVTIFPEEYKVFYNTLGSLGIPVIVCPGEAEAYGASLNANNIVYGVWTSDTDSYALGTINMITGFGPGYETLSVVNIPSILNDLELNSDEMRDFCIMCGNDFNDNISGVGTMRAYNLIKKYSSITNYESTGQDCKILNYVRSREILTAPHCLLTHNSTELLFNVESFNVNGKRICSQYNLNEVYERLKYHIHRPIKILRGNTSRLVIIKRTEEILP